MRAWRTWQKLFAFLCVVEYHLGICSVVNFLKLGFRIKRALACKWHLGLAPYGWLFLLVWLGSYFDRFGVTGYCLIRFWVWHNESLGLSFCDYLLLIKFYTLELSGTAGNIPMGYHVRSTTQLLLPPGTKSKKFVSYHIFLLLGCFF